MSDATVEKTSGFIDDLGDAARRNPISAALIGMGVLWLFASGKSAGRAVDLLRNTGLDRACEAARDTLDSAKAGLGVSRGAVGDAEGYSLDAVREKGADAVNQAAEYSGLMVDPAEIFETARDSLTDLFRAQPLALGAIGLAIGAGIAAALPNTEVEDAYLGGTAETIRSKATELAGRQVEKATTIANDVIDAAAEEARKQGLTVEGAKAAAGDVAGKMSRVAEAARKSVSERTG
jgi:hypothetical protein